MLLYLAPLVALIGLIMFLVARTNPDLKRIGEIMFFCGLLASLLLFGSAHGLRIP